MDTSLFYERVAALYKRDIWSCLQGHFKQGKIHGLIFLCHANRYLLTAKLLKAMFTAKYYCASYHGPQGSDALHKMAAEDHDVTNNWNSGEKYLPWTDPELTSFSSGPSFESNRMWLWKIILV